MGASWIHGISGNPLTELAQGSGIELLATSCGQTPAYAKDGQRIDLDQIAEDAEHLVKAARDAVDAVDQDMSL